MRQLVRSPKRTCKDCIHYKELPVSVYHEGKARYLSDINYGEQVKLPTCIAKWKDGNLYEMARLLTPMAIEIQCKEPCCEDFNDQREVSDTEL